MLLLAVTHPDDDDLERRFPLALAPRHARLHGEQPFAAQVALEIEQAGPFPDVPLTVVSSGRAPPWAAVARERIDSHNTRQQQLVALSTKGKHIVVPRLGLFPQASDAEVVVQAVREIIASCRNCASACHRPSTTWVGGSRAPATQPCHVPPSGACG